MMTVSDPIGAEHAASYFRREVAKDYYEEGGTIGRWFGAGARELGLKGGIEGEKFRAVLEGREPRSGRQLVRGSNGAGGKRIAGWDATFAAPKSVSICGLIGRDVRVIEAHEGAVREALGAIEQRLAGRVKNLRGGLVSANMVAGQFLHETNRNLDPHLHTHNVVVNLTLGASDEWTAVDSSGLFEMQRFGTSVYRAALAASLLEAGYRLRHGKHGAFEIEGITDAQIEFFSTRTREVLEDCAKRDAAANAANYKKGRRRTRPKKQHVSREALDEVWARASTRARLDLAAAVPRQDTAAEEPSPKIVPDLAPARPAGGASRDAVSGPTKARRARKTRRPRVEDPKARERAARADEAVSFAIRHLTERDAITDRDRIAEAALTRRTGYTRIGDVERAIDRAFERGDLVHHREYFNLVTTRETLALERGLVRALDDGAETLRPIALGVNLDAHDLSRDQERAARHVLEATDSIVGIQGVAGAGKTRALRAVREEVERAGLRVRGLAPTTGAAQELSSAGLDAATVASFLTRPGAEPGREVWIVDEAGLLSTAALADLVRHAGAFGARLVLVGDVRQHAAVEAGAPFRLLLKAGMRSATLAEIYRQKPNPELLAAVEDASQGWTRKAVARMEVIHAVVEISDASKRHDEMAESYVACPQGTLLVAPSNLEREDLNTRIRQAMRERGLLDAEEVEVEYLRSRDMTGARREVVAQYEDGDVLRYSQGSAMHAIARDTYATVVERDVEANLLTVRLPNGETRQYNPRRLRGVDVFKRETRRFAVGDRVQFRAPIRDRATRIANGQLATIVAIGEDRAASLHLDGQSGSVTIDLAAVRHLDHGYAVTSHSSQGKTVTRALVAVDTSRSRALVNDTQFYVSISRATHEVALFTDDRARLPSAVSRTNVKASALDPGPDHGHANNQDE